MIGVNPRNYYIAAVLFALAAVLLGYYCWVNYDADKGTRAALYLACTILCIIEVLLLIRNGKRRAKGIPVKKRNKL